jgi:hypothetical protein
MSEFKDIVLSCYRLFIACRGNIVLFLSRCKYYGITRLRIFGTITWGDGEKCQPVNPDYWTRAEALIRQIGFAGLGVDLDLEDGNSLDGTGWRKHWFVHEVVGNLELFWYPESWPLAIKKERKVYLKKWIAILENHNIDYRLAIINEPLSNIEPFIQWHYNALRALGIHEDRLIQSTATPGWTNNQYWKYADIIAPHAIYHKEQIGKIPEWAIPLLQGKKILYSGDGNIPFPTVKQLGDLGTAIRNDPQAIGYEMKANEEVGINPIMDVDKMDWTRVEAISKTLNPPEPEPPTPEPIYVKVKVCVETYELANQWCPKTAIAVFESGKEPAKICTTHKPPCSYWLKRLDFRRWFKCFLGIK